MAKSTKTVMLLVALYGISCLVITVFASTQESDPKSDIYLGDVDHQCTVDEMYTSEEHEKYCELYYNCGKGNTSTQLYQCSAGSVYGVTIHGCIGPSEKVNCGNRTRPFNCTSPNGTFPISPGACHPHYYLCVNGEHALEVCPHGSIFDESTGSCTETPTPACPYTCPEPEGQFPSPYTCTQFFTCVENLPYLQKCPPGLYYNTDPLILVCDWPENVPNCWY